MTIVFGSAVASVEKYERMALPGIERAAEPDSIVLTERGHESIQVPYNLMLDEAASIPGLEALVLLHEDAEIRDPRFCEKVRRSLSLPNVGALGPIGARGVRSIAWWAHGPCYGRIDAPNVAVDRVCRGEFDVGWHEVEAIDGLMMIASAWTVRNVRFDERFAPSFHGYDVDFSFQIRALGHRCFVAPLDVTHYGTWKIEQRERWIQSSMLWERKWGAWRAGASLDPVGLV
jgi:Glycosyltransferase like family